MAGENGKKWLTYVNHFFSEHSKGERMKAVFETVVTSEGGRNGLVRSQDNHLNLKISDPSEFGGHGNATNPEQLFAAAYAASFEASLQAAAQKKNKPFNQSKVTAHVQIGPDANGGFQLAVQLEVSLPGYGRDEGLILIEQANKICPYSNAVKNNIHVALTLVEA